MSRVFAYGPGDWGSIPGKVIPKTQKMVLDASLLNTQYYKVWSNPGNGVALFPTSQCSSYCKGSLWVTLDEGRRLYFYLVVTNFKKYTFFFPEFFQYFKVRCVCSTEIIAVY